MVPEYHEGNLIYAEHFTRYHAAIDMVKDKIVLDIASGSGYGTRMLAETADKVFGVDIDKGAVEYAQKNYRAKNIEYIVGDGEKIPLADNSVDVVITYETIEHIKNYGKFLDEIQRVLKDDGLLILSTPNDLEFAEGNHFHLHEFTESELLQLINKRFNKVKKYYQATWKYVELNTKGAISTSKDLNHPIVNLCPLSPDKFLYFYFLCSNREITEFIKPTGALGGHYSDRDILATHQEFIKQIENIKHSVVKLEKENELLRLGHQMHAQQLEARVTEQESINKNQATKIKLLKRDLKDTQSELLQIKTSRSYKLVKRIGTISH